jgi:hypothetical protein
MFGYVRAGPTPAGFTAIRQQTDRYLVMRPVPRGLGTRLARAHPLEFVNGIRRSSRTSIDLGVTVEKIK